MKRITVVAVLLLVSNVAFAWPHHHGDVVNVTNVTNVTVNNPPGPAGPAGAQGVQGIAGPEASIDNVTTVNVGAGIRWYDWKRVSLNSGYRYDANHGGHTIDAMMVMFKFGSSYEERRIEELKKQIESLRTLASLMLPQPSAPVTIRGGK